MNEYELDYDELMHYGTKYHSGRYPYGSGEDPYQHDGGFRGYIKAMKAKGLSETEIAKGLGMSSTELRRRASVERMEDRNMKVSKVMELHDKGLTPTQIGREMGINESTVRSYLNPQLDERNNKAIATAKMLKAEVDKYGTTSVSAGTPQRLNISDGKLKNALILLEREGYSVQNVPIKQVGTGKKTVMQVIVPPGQEWKETMNKVNNFGDIHIINDTYTEDGGRTWENIETPRSVSSKRVLVRYGDEGGSDKDGLIEIRPNVEDLDMGRNQYAQVRIAVDDTHYMKGMAIYNPDIPKGYDIIYNSNKPKGSPKDKVFKPLKEDPNNPFGATIKSNEYSDSGELVREVGQRHYIDKNGKKQLSAINIVNEEGDWQHWKKRLASQMLAKQSADLAKRQLGLAYDKKHRELEDIEALTNTAIKEKLLLTFADECDSMSVHLKAAALPGQQSHVLIPFTSLKSDEVYAPNYKQGEIVSLVRFPHEGIFQMPTLRVNNRGKTAAEARELLGNAPDAIGINIKVAQQLSGADFDGDSVLVIPNPNGKLLKSMAPLEGLKDFDTEMYARDKFPEGKNNWTPVKDTSFNEQMQMGMISNLIMDMTLKGATPDELARATRHSMTIIDAKKHDLNWKQSEKDNNIQELRLKYQGKKQGGASTLITKAKKEYDVPERKQFYKSYIDKETGEVDYYHKNEKGEYDRLTNRKLKKKDPKTGEYIQTDKPAMQESTYMKEIKDAYELSSGTKMEEVYADYANSMKKMANEARKEAVHLQNMKYNKEAAKVYAPEVASILNKLNDALKNKPLEQKAQVLANYKLRMWKAENPTAEFEDIKKHSGNFLKEARQRMGSAKHRIKLTPKEWEAIQAGAITQNRFLQILNNTDLDVIKEYATPREYVSKLSRNEIAYARNLLSQGRYTQAEIADLLGVSVSTLQRAVEKK